MQVMHQERPFQMQNLWNAKFTFLAPHLCKAQSDFPNNAMLQKLKTVIERSNNTFRGLKIKLPLALWFERLRI